LDDSEKAALALSSTSMLSERSRTSLELARLRSLLRPGPGGWKFKRSDAVAGATGAVANIPDSMASAALAGVSPVFGLYTLILALPVTAAFVSAQFMIFNVTSAVNLIAASGLGDLEGEERVEALGLIALVAGLFQVLLGVLGLGQLTRFVSASVMTGFLTGIGIVVILGQLWSLTGYEGDSGNKLAQTVDLATHIGEIDLWTTALGVSTLLLIARLDRSRFSTLSLMFGLAAATAVGALIQGLDWASFAQVSDLGAIPSGLPTPDVPSLRHLSTALIAGIPVGAVGVLMALGVGQSFPNPDDEEINDSRDFVGQGLANSAASFFRGAPGNGAVGMTTVSVRAGASSRWAAVAQAGVVMIVLLLFSELLGKIPLTALAALLIYTGLLLIKPHEIAATARTDKISLITMIVVIFLMLVMPLHYAVMLGIVVDALYYIFSASRDINVMALRFVDGQVVEEPAPEFVPSNSVTVLDAHGSLFYAGAHTLGHLLPNSTESTRSAVVLRLRGHRELGTTFCQLIVRYGRDLQRRGGRLFLSGVDPSMKERLVRGGYLGAIGEENVFFATPVLGQATREAIATAEAWLAQDRDASIEAESKRGSEDSQRPVVDDRPPAGVRTHESSR
jgi:SulP family sulfate permease